ncbi:MAG: DMT family transporter [Dokdonella sp.]|uniref:DMT family transporter n=1 Tax=Dokdonella sp. TaxID=2291710 RepID=UPI003F7F46F5
MSRLATWPLDREADARVRRRAMAVAFVVLWCTGYPAGLIAVQHAAPFTILFLRFASAGAIFAAMAFSARARRPAWREVAHHAVVGVLSLAIAFGGIYEALRLGIGTGLAALFVGALPLASATIGLLLGERMRAVQWVGLAFGLAGVVLVLQGRFGGSGDTAAYAASTLSLFALAAGTHYQKRRAPAIDLRVALAVQHLVAALALLPVAMLVEHFRIDAGSTFAAALAWLVLVNSVGGFALWFTLLRGGAATEVATLFFLMPPVTALMGWLVLGEHLAPAMIPGFALVAFGVWLGTRVR